MRIRITPVKCLLALLLCGASAALAQNLSGGVVAGEDASSASAVDSAISASISSIADSAVNAAEISSASGSGFTSGAGSSKLGPGFPQSAITPGLAAAIASLTGPASGVALRNGSGNLSVAQSAMVGSRGQGRRLNQNLPAGQVIPRASFAGKLSRVAASRNAGMPGQLHPHAVEAEGAASASGGFPDSTRGTGFPSPPDPETSSPLSWTPGFDFGFTDFDQNQFLNPSLTGPATAAGKHAHGRAAMLYGHRGTLSKKTPSVSTSPLESQSLESQALEPDLRIEPAQFPTIEQQLGLEQ